MISERSEKLLQTFENIEHLKIYLRNVVKYFVYQTVLRFNLYDVLDGMNADASSICARAS